MIVPNHIALITDGNRRWARAHHLPPWQGHWEGAKIVDNFLDWCLELGIHHVSVWASSTENLTKRSKKEVQELYKVYYSFLKNFEKKKTILDKYEVKVRFIGDIEKLPKKLTKLMGKIMQKTANYQKKFLNILMNYGGKFELLEVFKKIANAAIKLGRIEITERDIEKNLLVQTPVDLVIRTGGMARLSNFMLWQTSYAELIFLPTLLPDFTKEELIECIKEYNRRQRRFGK